MEERSALVDGERETTLRELDYDESFQETLILESDANESDNKAIADVAISEDESGGSEVKSWYTVNVFLFFLASFQLINLLTLTYSDSVLNFIAKRFHIPNTMASFIPSSYQVGNMVAIMPVSYFGANWHRPRAICIGVMLMLFGLGFCILPHFILPTNANGDVQSSRWLCDRNGPPPFVMKKYLKELKEHNVTFPLFNWTTNYTDMEYTSNWNDVPHLLRDSEMHHETSWFNRMLINLGSYYHSPDSLIKPSLTTPRDLPCNANATMYNPSILLILGHVIIGAGSSPLWPLGVSYLDDHLVNRQMPVYLGIFIGTTLTGPVVGFLLGSLSSAIYVTIDSHDMKPDDPAWIGAWWLGYVIAGGLLLILLVPFYFFPRKLEVTEEKLKEREEYQVRLAAEITESDERSAAADEVVSLSSCSPEETIPLLCEETTKHRIWRTTKDAICSVRRVITIPLVFCCFFAYIMLANLLSGVSTFGSTFIERQFNVLRITSDMLIGGVCVPLAIAGTFAGGFIMKKMEFNTNQSIYFNVLMSSIGTVFLTILFALGCETLHIAGVSRPYLNEKVINVTSECNADCGCVRDEIHLLCSRTNITYISPCFAGCMNHIPASKDSNIKEAYSDCSCLEDASQPLYLGPCTTPSCTGLLAGATISASIGIFILCFCQAPTYTILLRSLADDDKPLAIGLLTFLSKILGFIPAPIWFAMVIDKSCIYWGPECKGKAVCQLYNNRGLRLNFVGGCVTCSFAYAFTFAVAAAWLFCTKRFDKLRKDATDHTGVTARAKSRDWKRKRLTRMRSFTR